MKSMTVLMFRNAGMAMMLQIRHQPRHDHRRKLAVALQHPAVSIKPAAGLLLPI